MFFRILWSLASRMSNNPVTDHIDELIKVHTFIRGKSKLYKKYFFTEFYDIFPIITDPHYVRPYQETGILQQPNMYFKLYAFKFVHNFM